MEIVATTSLPAVDRPNADRWNAARSRQNEIKKIKKKIQYKIKVVQTYVNNSISCFSRCCNSSKKEYN